MVLRKLSVPGRPARIKLGQGPSSLAVGVGGSCLDIFLIYRLKYCLKRPLNINQPTNQPRLMAADETDHSFQFPDFHFTMISLLGSTWSHFLVGVHVCVYLCISDLPMFV